MSDFELTMALRNNQLLSRRRALKKSPREMAELAGVGYGYYLQYEKLKANPIGKNSRWKISALKIAAAFGVEPEDLWPDVVLSVVKPTIVKEIKGEEMALLAGFYQQLDAPKNIEVLAIHQEEKLALDQALSELTPWEQQIIQDYFLMENPRPI